MDACAGVTVNLVVVNKGIDSGVSRCAICQHIDALSAVIMDIISAYGGSYHSICSVTAQIHAVRAVFCYKAVVHCYRAGACRSGICGNTRSCIVLYETVVCKQLICIFITDITDAICCIFNCQVFETRLPIHLETCPVTWLRCFRCRGHDHRLCFRTAHYQDTINNKL